MFFSVRHSNGSFFCFDRPVSERKGIDRGPVDFVSTIRKVITLLIYLACAPSAMAAWTQQQSGTLAWLRSIYFIDQNNGWTVGSKGTFLSTTDGGRHWEKARKFTEDNIRDVYFSDARNGWLLCESDIYDTSRTRHSYLLRTSDGGGTWERIDFLGEPERIVRFFFSQEGKGTAVGEGGAIFQMQNESRSWKKTALPVRFLILDGVHIDNLRTVLVGGGGTVLFSDDAGNEWSRAVTPATARTKLNSVFFADDRNGWAVGTEGKIYATKNGGKLWREQVTGTNDEICDVIFLDPNEGYAVGSGGGILHTVNGGEAWNITRTKTKNRLERVFFVGKKGYIVGFGGLILTSDDSDRAEKSGTRASKDTLSPLSGD